MSKQVEITVLKNKAGVTQTITKKAYTSAKIHFDREGWKELSDSEKKKFFADKLPVEKPKAEKPKAAKPKKEKTVPAPSEETEP